jgi:hypothetical protein
VSCRRPDPSTLTTNTAIWVPPEPKRSRQNTSRRPSGDQRGKCSCPVGASWSTTDRSVPVAGSMMAMPRRSGGRPGWSPADETTASCRPPGDQAGSHRPAHFGAWHLETGDLVGTRAIGVRDVDLLDVSIGCLLVEG